MQWLGAVATVVTCAALFACAKTPYQLKRDSQARQVEQLRPAELEHESASWRALRTWRVRFYLDAAALRSSGRPELEDRLQRANEVLATALQLRLVLQDVRELPSELLRMADTEHALLEVERLDPGQDVDLVIAILGASPVVTLSFHDLGRGRVLGKHVVMRTMDDTAEIRALEGFDTLDASERARLYQQRKRHKETAVLLHELGHVLGALHTRADLDLMHPAYDDDMRGYAPANLELMRAVVDHRLSAADARDERALVERIAAHLRAPPPDVWVEAERESYLADLERALAQNAGALQAAAASDPAAPSASPAGAEPGLDELSEPDRERYRGIEAALEAKRYAEVKATILELGGAYPDSYTVQQKACQTAMRLRLPTRELKPLCDRMLKLSMQPGADRTTR